MTFGRQKVPLTPVHHEYRAEHDRNDGKRRQARDQVVRECADDDAGTSGYFGYFGKGYERGGPASEVPSFRQNHPGLLLCRCRDTQTRWQEQSAAASEHMVSGNLVR